MYVRGSHFNFSVIKIFSVMELSGQTSFIWLTPVCGGLMRVCNNGFFKEWIRVPSYHKLPKNSEGSYLFNENDSSVNLMPALSSCCHISGSLSTFALRGLLFKEGFIKDKICLMRRFLFFSVTAISASLQGNEEYSIIACWLNKAVIVHAGDGTLLCFWKAGIS